MKKSLLEIVQEILNDLDSDEVNSIDDTVESQQVASIVQSSFNELISNRNWPHLRKLVQLEASNELVKPNYLKLPEGTKELEFFKYDKHKFGDERVLLQNVLYKSPEEFLSLTSGRNSTLDTVQTVIDFSGTQILIFNNLPPSFYTSFDDRWLVVDSYDASVDDTLKKSKTQAMAYIEPVWVHEDDAVPDLPTDAFAALIEEAKSTAFVVIKQEPNQKAEQKAVRQQSWLSRKARKIAGGVRYPNYGRRGRR